MIKLNTSRFTDLLPATMAGQVEIQAFAYAVGRQISTLCAYADNTRIYAALASLPEKTLDYLAVELRTPAYNENFSIGVKRALIESTMTFYAGMGTPAACNRIIEIIFGAGSIREWWEYGGHPHHFKAHTTNPSITQDDVDTFRRVLGGVKRLSAWLDDIVLELSTPALVLSVGHWVHTGDFITLRRANM